ncbi:MAG TPA: PD-(D/E)XK nuclease family protein [Candidatus Angelobacter sp.]|nr:PD-(D/E)XK nuclease family protein [Candidatus Angelobacter sp.]
MKLQPYGRDLGDLSSANTLLHQIGALSREAVSNLYTLLRNPELLRLARQYTANLKKRNVDLGFNLFAIISDFYYRENFHSDILRALLDPDGHHKEKALFFDIFIDFLKSHGAHLNPKNYLKVSVVREEGRVDLLIKDAVSKRAIILESKINGAGDMPRQIPRYLEYVRATGYECDAIVYLRLNGYSGPDKSDWTIDDCRRIDPILRVVCAYDESKNDLFNGWIAKCKRAAANSDSEHVLRQYGDLIKKLGGNVMNKPIMEKFYQIVMTGENLKTALSLKAMLDDLILFRVERLIDEFKSDLGPFRKISNWNNDDAYFTGLLWKGAHLGLDIVVKPEAYVCQFWDREDRECAKRRAQMILERMGCLGDFVRHGEGFIREFSFPSQEDELVHYVRAFKNKLTQAVADEQKKKQ